MALEVLLDFVRRESLPNGDGLSISFFELPFLSFGSAMLSVLSVCCMCLSVLYVLYVSVGEDESDACAAYVAEGEFLL